ncbi:MAG: protein kinase [Myxococcota bacterium]
MQSDLELLISEHSPTDSGHVDRVRERLFSSGPSERSSGSKASNPIDRVRERLFGTPRPFVPARYELLERIGKGGFGDVYRAMDTELGRSVAIKLVRYSSAREEARIKREAEALAQVEHPNVVGVHERGTNGAGVYYLVLEYVPGIRLDAWLDAEPRTLTDILNVFLQAAEGLRAVHAEGLVHRDLKPANLLVGHDGRTRVLDFGLARRVTRPRDDSRQTVRTEQAVGNTGKGGTGPFRTVTQTSLARCVERAPTEPERRLLDGDSCSAVPKVAPASSRESGRQRCAQQHLDLSLTQAGKFAGTPGYASLEQLVGDKIDARADVFSFCVTLFEAVHGQRPFPGSGRTEIEHAVRRGRIGVRASRRIPRWLEAMLRRGLSPHPAERPRDFDEVIRILRKGMRPRSWPLRLVAATALLTASVTALAVERTTPPAAPTPPTMAEQWQSSPQARARLSDRYGEALVAQLDDFERKWLSVSETVIADSGPATVVECLRTGQQQFTTLIEGLSEGTVENRATLASMAPSRLWFTELFDPTQCSFTRMDEGRRAAIDRLLKSQIEQFEGNYEQALQVVNIAADVNPEGPLDRLTGAIQAQTGHLQMLLDDRDAWTMLGRAAYASGDDLEFFVEVLSMRLMAGVYLGIFRDRPEDVLETTSMLAEALERLDEQRYVARAWHQMAEGQLRFQARTRHGRTGEDSKAAQIHFERAREYFALAPKDHRYALNLATADLQTAYALAEQGEHESAADRGVEALERLDALLGTGHPYLDRCRVDVAQMIQNARGVFDARARSLLRTVVDGKEAGDIPTFERVRAAAKLLYQDTAAARRDGTVEGNEALFQRSLELESELRAHLGNPRRDDLAKIAMPIAKTRLVTFEGKPETLAAVELWAEYEQDPGRSRQAHGFIETLNKK